MRTELTSDRAERVTRILHTEPAAVPAEPVPVPEVALPAKNAKTCPTGGAAGYLDRRTLQNLEGEDQQCVKTGDYLKRRTLPAPDDPVSAGGALQYDYTYTEAGKVATATRQLLEAPEAIAVEDPEDTPNGTPEAPTTGPAAPAVPEPPVPVSQLQSEFDYDGLGRLTAATKTELLTESGTPETVSDSTYKYDAAGNRVFAETTANNVTRTMTQQYGDGNRLLSATTVTDGSEQVRTYGYDGAGRRTSVRGAERADYAYGWGGQPTRVTEAGVTTRIDYDGLDRAVTKQIEGAYSSDAVTSSYLGGALTGISSTLHGDTSMLWGALGEIEGIVRAGDDAARWALLDRLGTVVAEATGAGGADISELVSYADYGAPDFESVGYVNPYGYTGELQDGGTGRVSFFARDYDPGTATWLAPDQWPGLIVAPQTLNRYGYVLGDPVTFIDMRGFQPVNPSALANHVGKPAWGASQVKPRTVNPSALLNHVDRPSYFAATGRSLLAPATLSDAFTSARHANATRVCIAGDWSCSVRQAQGELICTEAGNMRQCVPDSGPGLYTYRYQYDWKVANGGLSPEEVMDVFKKNPGKIFPFTIEGCTEFRTGDECYLKNATGVPVHWYDSGWVGVTTGDKYVKFTVTRNGYFDAPGSTIKFSTWADSNGNVYLRQTAAGYGADLPSIVGIKGIKMSEKTWNLQQNNLEDLLK